MLEWGREGKKWKTRERVGVFEKEDLNDFYKRYMLRFIHLHTVMSSPRRTYRL